MKKSKSHYIYLVPGMFGFAQIAGYHYFIHIERALAERFEEAGISQQIKIVPAPPTGSIRKRSSILAETIFDDLNDNDRVGPIHLIGHSTGGLDIRLLASPAVDLNTAVEKLEWTERVQNIITINTPHYGTPLAQFFATVSGTRLLYLLSLLSFTTLRFGKTPLSILSTLLTTIGRIDERYGIELKLLNRVTELLLRFIGEKEQQELRDWLNGMLCDQGGIIQITPESMDLFNAAVKDCGSIRYGCLATGSPTPSPVGVVKKIFSPYAAVSATWYSTLYTFTARAPTVYSYATLTADEIEQIERGIGNNNSPSMNDGIVPTQSMLWGKLLWTGCADHLDILGHFNGIRGTDHADWLESGSRFDQRSFSSAMDAVANFLLA